MKIDKQKLTQIAIRDQQRDPLNPSDELVRYWYEIASYTTRKMGWCQDDAIQIVIEKMLKNYRTVKVTEDRNYLSYLMTIGYSQHAKILKENHYPQDTKHYSLDVIDSVEEIVNWEEI